MEKITDEQARNRWHRLLIFFFAGFLVAVQANGNTFDQFESYEVEPQEAYFFVGQPCEYVLELPGLLPSQVQIAIPDTASDIQFLRLKKNRYSDSSDKTGTKLQVWFMFLHPFEQVALPHFKLFIENRQYSVPVKSVSVYEDPLRVFPEAYAVYDAPVDTVRAGDTLYFTLYVRYCAQLLHFSWELPKNSIFTEIERYDGANGAPQNTAFSPHAVPVSRFSWTPLVAGVYDFPALLLDTVAYNGTHHVVSPVSEKIVVQTAQDTQSDAEQTDSLFLAAQLSEANVGMQQSSVSTLSPEQCKQLAHLRSAERNAFPFSRASRERKRFEAQWGILSSPEPSVRLPCILLVAAVACILFAGGMVLLNRPQKKILPLVLALFYLGGALWGYSVARGDYAIFAGGLVYPVPEDTAIGSVQIMAGERVKIVEKAGDWVYIMSNANTGWVKYATVYRIAE